jgi:hypothetical protein
MSNVEQGRNAGGEYYFNREAITVESILEDNRSAEAERRRSEWNENRENKRLTLLNTCSDARIVIPNPTSTAVVRSIAAGRSLEPFGKLISHKSIDNVHIMGHHAGNKVVEGAAPRGCGGLGVKEDQMQHDKVPHSEVEEWVSENVCHSDSLYHAFMKAAETQDYTDKEILLSTQDHLDHTIYPMAGFLGSLKAPIHYEDFGQYNSGDIYKSGIPSLPSTELKGTSFEQYLEKYFNEQLPDLLASYSEHDRTTQEVQDPKLLLITTNVAPSEVLYPNLSRRPNKIFVETLAREKIQDELIITEKGVKDVISQAQYPISHFTNINTVFIETGDITKSSMIAKRLTDKVWFKPWMERTGTKILVGETKAGKLEDLRKF